MIFGGAKFHVPSPEVLRRLYEPAMVRQLWNGAVDGIPTIPRDGTLLREEGDSQVFIMQGGRKVAATSFPQADVRVVWDGGLAGIP